MSKLQKVKAIYSRINFLHATESSSSKSVPCIFGVVLLLECSLYTNIPQEEGIKVVCKYYNDHYQPNPPIPTSTLGDLMKLILKENSFHFNGKHFLQTYGIAMGTKMAVAFSVIFMALVEKQLLLSSPHKAIIWKRFIDDIFSV